MRFPSILPVVALVGSMLLACKGGPEAVAAGGPNYRVLAPAISVAVGSADHADISFQPQGDYHWNAEYPAKAKVTNPGALAVDKSEFAAADFQDRSGTGVLSVPLAGKSAGDTRLAVSADFSMCSAKNCLFFKGIPVEVPVHVQ